MMAWSVKPGQAHLNRDGIRQIRSELTNDIFRHELAQVLEKMKSGRGASSPNRKSSARSRTR